MAAKTSAEALRLASMTQKNYLFPEGLRKWAYNASRWNQLGLMHDDLLDEMKPHIKEAVRRLPDDMYDERMFRLVRAMQLTCNKRILPKEQWTKMEEDVKYLQPYIDEVLKEMKEKEDWENQE